MPLANYGMSGSNYAAGDYYRGDYYSYGAGGLLSFAKKAFGVVKGAVTGFAKGGPLGAVTGAVSAAAGKQKDTAQAKQAQLPVLYASPQGMLPDVPRGTPGAVPQPGMRGAIERVLPGGQSGYVPGSAVGAATPGGWHWNKSYSYAKGLPAGSFLVRNRSMNPANAKSLRRAIRRQQSFVALARRVLRGTGMTIKRSGVGGKRRAVARRR